MFIKVEDGEVTRLLNIRHIVRVNFWHDKLEINFVMFTPKEQYSYAIDLEYENKSKFLEDMERIETDIMNFEMRQEI